MGQALDRCGQIIQGGWPYVVVLWGGVLFSPSLTASIPSLLCPSFPALHTLHILHSGKKQPIFLHQSQSGTRFKAVSPQDFV